MSDLTLPEARTERDSLAARTDVLDKVGVLRTLPDGLHVTTPMVAEFYGVGIEAVRSLVKDNRDEIEEDGYRVIVRSEFEKSFGDLSNLDPRARQIALFPRRAVLRVGMLLRDSDTAKQVRTYLLDAEQSTVATFHIPQTYAEALRAAADQSDRADRAESRAKELEPKAEFYDELMESDGTYSMLATSKILGWGRNVMMRDLRRMAILQGNNLPYQRYEHHFKVVPGTYRNRNTGETVPTATTFVRPSGLEFLRKKLDGAPAVVNAPELTGVGS